MTTTEVQTVVSQLRDVLGAVERVAEGLPDAVSAVAVQRRAEVLGDRMGELAEAEMDRRMTIYNQEWARVDAERAKPAEDEQAARLAKLKAERAQVLTRYFERRTALIDAEPCALVHDWVTAPAEVAAFRVCRKCAAESSVSPA